MRKSDLPNLSLLRLGAFIAAMIFSGAASGAATTAPINQTNAQAIAEDLNRKASDQSMQSSTTSAMKALMHFANGEMPSAVNNGMTAYGKYRNSENLDKLGDQNTVNAASMASAGETGITKVVKTSTSFRRLNADFLRSGEAGAVAAEFEKKSGMKREQFLQELSDVSEKKISRNDPQLMDKVLSRFEGFASRIPNAEFRTKIEKGIHKVPSTVRNGLIGKAIAKFAGFMSGGSSEVTAPAPVAGKPVSTLPAAESKEPIAAEAPAAETPDSGLSHGELVAAANTRPVDSKGAPSADILGSVIGDAIRTQAQDPTIFEQVTRKYREVTVRVQK